MWNSSIWWQQLSGLNKIFFASAFFFSILAIWQFIASIVGMGGHAHGHLHHTGHVHHSASTHTHSGQAHHGASQPHSGHSVTRTPFTVVSLQSIIAFGTLFSWAGALYLMEKVHAAFAILFGFGWGLAAMFAVSIVLYWLLNLEEIGNIKLADALGEEGIVYIDVPAEGFGQVRVTVDGVVSYVRARSRTGELLVRGAKVRVVGIVDDKTIEVEAQERLLEGD
jgi:hypothetical protein